MSDVDREREMISNADLSRVHGFANFGDMTPRDVIRDGVVKYAMGYTGGHTQLTILIEHGLIHKPKPGSYQSTLTKKGRAYLRAIMPTWAGLTTIRAALDRAEARTAELEACLDAAEKDCRISDNGNMWRFWADKCREMAARLTRAEADAREAALQYLSDTGQMGDEITELRDQVAALEADIADLQRDIARYMTIAMEESERADRAEADKAAAVEAAFRAGMKMAEKVCRMTAERIKDANPDKPVNWPHNCAVFIGLTECELSPDDIAAAIRTGGKA